VKRTFKYHLSRLWFPVLALLVLTYFLYYFLYGNHGYYAMGLLQSELRHAKEELQKKREEHDCLSHRVSLMKADSLDKDLLEERVRAILDYAHKKDIVVFDNEIK
jgi:cell division protein FtsB